MERHALHSNWIIAAELDRCDDRPTGSSIAFRSAAVTMAKDYEDGTVMIWTSDGCGGTLVAGNVDALIALIEESE